MWDGITYPSPKFSCAAVKIWEWIINFIPRFTGHVILYPCWRISTSWSILVKRALWIIIMSWYIIKIIPVRECLSNFIPNLHHDGVIERKHFPRNWPSVRGIHRSPVNSPRKGQWRWALIFSLICARTNSWVNKSKRRWFETLSRSLWRHRNVRWASGHVIQPHRGNNDVTWLGG